MQCDQLCQVYSRSHDAVIRVYDEAGNVIETQTHDFRESSANPCSPADVPHRIQDGTASCPFARAKTFTKDLASSCNRVATLHSDALPPSL
jgi:hypothetical protein